MNAFQIFSENPILDYDPKTVEITYQEDRPGLVTIYFNGEDYGSIIKYGDKKWNLYLGGCFQGTVISEESARDLIAEILNEK